MGHLIVDPAAAWYVKDAATALLVLHIGGGTVGLVSGTVALATRKGGRLHSLSGRAFMVSMLSMAGIGAAVAPFMADPVSTVAGIMTLYLLVSSWLTVKRRPGQIGRIEPIAALVPLGVTLAGAIFMFLASKDPSGTVDGQPPQAFYMFVIVGSIAAAADLRLVLRRGVAGAERLARHLWRMCTALFVASGSLFLGQPQVFPAAIRHSSLMYLPALAPLLVLIFWMIRVRLVRRYRPVGAAVAA